MMVKFVINIGIAMIFMLALGCIKHVDRLETFHITGRVIGRDEMPIMGVEIFFRDRGFDYVRSKDFSKGTFKIGETNNEGYFDLSFQYWWGHNKALFKKMPEQKFELIFSKPGFVDRSITYDYKLLTQKDEAVEVEVGKIVLGK